jgi:hypothetical protein
VEEQKETDKKGPADFEVRLLAVYEGKESGPRALRTQLEASGATVRDGIAVRKGVRASRLEVALPQQGDVFLIPTTWPDPVVRLLEFTFPKPDVYLPRVAVRRPTGPVVGPFGTRRHHDGTRTLLVLGEPKTIVLLRNMFTGTGHFVNVAGTPRRLTITTRVMLVTEAWLKELERQRNGRGELVPWMKRVQDRRRAIG